MTPKRRQCRGDVTGGHAKKRVMRPHGDARECVKRDAPKPAQANSGRRTLGSVDHTRQRQPRMGVGPAGRSATIPGRPARAANL
jgi:hypothetical protein